MEAVSNSIHAITDRFDDDTVKRGRVDLTIVRDMENEDEPIIGGIAPCVVELDGTSVAG
jgi:hypothetical protein